MFVVGWVLRLLAGGLDAIGSVFQRLAILLHSLLPALLSPADLMKLIKDHYDTSYAHTAPQFTTDVYEWALESWEQEVVQRHSIASGRILVLGAGVGREAIALAKRGLSVVGLDVNGVALQVATKTAQTSGVPAQFVQADFLHLPFTPAHFRYVIMSGIMYSSIPGRAQRQAWLANLLRHLAPEGLVILNFLIDHPPPSRIQRIGRAINRVLVALPGANRAYQPGDSCAQGHFLHAFQDESEIREELEEAGVQTHELNWRRGFAVVSVPRNQSGPTSPFPSLTRKGEQS